MNQLLLFDILTGLLLLSCLVCFHVSTYMMFVSLVEYRRWDWLYVIRQGTQDHRRFGLFLIVGILFPLIHLTLSAIFITNTSPLFYPHQIDRLNLLSSLYGQVTVPNAVHRELQVGQSQGLSIPILEQLNWITLSSATACFLPNLTDLGEGEAKSSL
jgi:hypothetical protein